ncbi:hypothetical protein AGR4A_pAt30020 [Agrobacterium tumefaciens str. B6]|uniref:Mutator family transposase n=1 Tax=Agrobacterium tumefaciens str. B6 TaxID=1183423 RepID=A0A822VBB0_AGRTU|nr:hypothetical protein AGR4A_pAt30020 [Agrobacterium tumefaciens str. B6]
MQHRTKLHSTNPLERLNKEVKRRADVVGIFPNEDSIVRLIGAVLLEANDEWQLLSRYMQVEAMAELNPPRRKLHFKLHPEPPDHDGPEPHPKLHQLDGRYHVRDRRAAPTTTHRSVEHPRRDFKKSIRGSTRKAAAENMRPFGQGLMNVNELPRPRMPRIQKLANLGPAGVLSSRCTILDVPIHLLTGRRRIRLTSTLAPMMVAA